MKRTITDSRFLRFFFITTAIFILHTKSNATVWTVTSNADAGAGTLRNIIAGASATDLITFNASMTITLLSTLTITKTLNIDATLGTGWSAGNNQVTIAGNGSIGNGLQFSATGISIKGITFQNFASNAIFVSNSTNYTIKSCFFNTNATATAALASANAQAEGIYISGASSGGIIGGPNAGDGNVFYMANSNLNCISLNSIGGMSAATKIIIQGNKFGTDYTGTVNFGLGTNSGIQCIGMNYVQIGGLGAGEGNQFEGSTGSLVGAIRFTATSAQTNMTIQGNKIGTVGACYNGILLDGGGICSTFDISNNTINNSTTYAVNISGMSASSTGISIAKNSFSNNASGGINTGFSSPTISSATPGKIMGSGAAPNATVNIYTWDGVTSSPQGTTWVATAIANASGVWFSYATFTVGQIVVVTGTSASPTLTTTHFSGAFTVTTCPTTVNAGLDQSSCATSSSVPFTGSTSGGTSPGWTIVSGFGSLSGAGTLSPTYIPSAAEQSSASNVTVTLQLTVSTSTCAATISDQVNLTINPKPTASAGTNQPFCANAASGVVLNGAVTNGSGAWSGGSGTFSPDANTLNASYIPAAGERTAGNAITLTLTATGIGSCMFATATSTMVINVTAAPTINIGADQTVCANSIPATTANLTVASGVSWSGGAGAYTPSSTALNMTYQPTAAEITAGQVILTAITTSNGSCSAVSTNKKFTFTPAPTVNAGADQSACVPVGTVSLTGSVTVATGGHWTTSGGGSISNPNSLTPIYSPSTAENATTAPLNITFTLVTTGNGSCASVTDQMILKLTPTPTVNAGADRTICAINSNIFMNGAITGVTTSTWTTSGTGIFTNPSSLTTDYRPSTADKNSGTVTLTLTASGGGCTSVSDAMILTIQSCLLDPKLTFDTPNLFKNNGADPFKHTYTTNSAGTITYDIRKASNLSTTSCATIGPNGFIQLTCVDTLRVTAYQASKGVYDADTAYFTLYVGRAVTKIELESRGGIALGPDFRLQVKTNYDQPLTYSIVGGDASIISMTTDGLITPLAVGSVYISAHAAGDANYQPANSINVLVNIYPNLTPPVAINDTLHMFIGETKTVHLADNDYGTTASINLSPMQIDIDAENPGIQEKYFRPGIGIFTVDSSGVLTFSAFQAFIGVDSIQYTITDSDGLTSKRASFVFYVTSPVAEIALKANEIITANGDNLNNALVVGYTDLTQSNDLLVVDAAGNKLYYEKNYQNNWSATDSSGNNLGNGVYYYIFREFDALGTVRRQLKGNFTVIR